MVVDRKFKREPLRQRAEKPLSKKSPRASKVEDKGFKKLVHELEVHQVELEMQNEELRKAQEVIEESRQKYSDLYDFAPIGYFTFSSKGEILEVNLTGASLLGIEREKLIRRPFAAFVEAEFQSHFRDYCRNMLSSGKPERCELKLIKKDGKPFYASLRSIVVRHDNSIRIRSAVSDISELKKAQAQIQQLNAELEDRIRQRTGELKAQTEQLRREVASRKLVQEAIKESEERFRTLANATFEGIAITEQGRIVDANERLVQIIGGTRSELIGQEVASLIVPEDRDRVMANILQGAESHTEHQMFRRDDTRITVETHGRSIDYQGRQVRITAIRDITERKWAEEKLRESEEKHRAIVQTANEGIITVDAESTTTYVNETFAEILGLLPEELIGQNITKYFDKEDIALALAKREERRQGVRNSYEAKLVRKDGARIWVLVNSSPLFDGAGTFVGSLGMITDISERKRVEETLRESEGRYRTLFETAPDAIVVHRDGRFLDANDEALQLMGASSFQELASYGVLDFFRPEDREQSAERMRLATEEGKLPTREATLVRLDGREVTVEFHTARMEFQGAPAVQTIIRDITEWKQMEEEITHLASFPKLNPNPVIEVDLKGNISYMNSAAGTLFSPRSPIELNSWGTDFDSLVHSFVSDKRPIRREIQLGESWYQQIIHYVEELHRIRFYWLDVTERKRAEEALQESETRERERADELATLLDVVPTPVIIIHNPECTHMTGNRAAHELLKLPRNGEISLTAPLERRPLHYKAVKEGRELRLDELPARRAAMGEDVKDFEYTLVLDDGTTRELVAYGTPLRDQRGNLRGAVHTLVDITDRKRAEEALLENEERLRLAQESGNVGVWERYPTGEAYFSPETNRMYGLSPATIQVYQDWRARVHPDDIVRIEAEREAAILGREPFDFEFRILHSSGEIRWINSKGKAIYNESGEIIRLIGVNIDITDRKRIEEELRQRTLELQHLTETLEERVKDRTEELSSANKALAESQSRLQYLSMKLLETQEEERKRFATEVHDSFSSSLSALKHRIDVMQTGNGTPTEDLERLKSQVQGLIEESRRIQMALRPSILDDLGIVAALGWFTREFQKTYSHMGATKEIHVEEQDIPNRVKTPIFRITQEAFHNAVKHSKAKSIKLSLVKKGGSLRLEIQDNGIGVGSEILQSKEDRGRGLGLLSMEERASLSGGVFAIHSEVDKGTTIRVSWPLTPSRP